MMPWLIIIPIAAGLAVLLLPSRIKGLAEAIALLVSACVFVLAGMLFFRVPLSWSCGGSLLLRLDKLSGFILPAAGLFGILIVLYSLKYMAGHPRLKEYYAYLLITLGGTNGVLLADNLLLLLVFWGLVGITLYMLVGVGGASAAPAAKKTFLIVGGSDALMLLGLAIVWLHTGVFRMSESSLPLDNGLLILAFLCLLSAAFAKAGAMPFHTWIPACAESAPVPVMALLPASLDKLLGIYLLVRISLQMFKVLSNPALSIILMALGAITVLAAVMMALIQHRMKKLLSYHAVSQVGYMVLGIGTGVPIGIVGGIFHMLNHAIYKACLFLTSGAVERKCGTDELDKLGGLVKVMPLTFISFLIAALAISGIPPLNGFVSKWMIYQGIIESGRGGGPAGSLWVIWLIAAMFGSALTLASFMKLLFAVFLGKGERADEKRNEVGWMMWVPMMTLAFLCVLFGVFAYSLPLKRILAGVVPGLGPVQDWLGWWSPGLATGLIVIGLVLGALIYRLGTVAKFRESVPYIGGERNFPPRNRVTGTDFYGTIRDLPVLRVMYRLAGKGVFDIYTVLTGVTFYCIDFLRSLHTGILSVYLTWAVFGLLILTLVLLGSG